jgi:hypothetical protein
MCIQTNATINVNRKKCLKISLSEMHFAQGIRVVSDIYRLTEKIGEKK